MFRKLIHIILILSFSNCLFAAKFSSERIENAIRQIVLDKVKYDYHMEILTPLEDIRTSSANSKILFDDNSILDKQIVKVIVKDGERTLNELNVRFELYTNANVYVTKIPVKRGNIISEDMVELKNLRVPVRTVNNLKADIFNQIAIKDISESEILTNDNSSNNVKIERGESVTLTVFSNGVRIRAKGKALDEGMVGDRIRVQRDGAKKILEAVLNESGELELND